MQRLRLYAEPPTQKRRTVLNLHLITAFCDLIVKGLAVDAVCDYLSISNNDYYDWMRKGKKYLERDKPSKMQAIFLTRFKKALAMYRLDRVNRLHDSTNRNWYKELAILERRDRKTYGRNEQPGGSDDTFDPDERFL